MCAKVIVSLIFLAPFIMAQESNYKPGEMLVFFKSGVVALAPGEQKGGIETMISSEDLRIYLNTLGFQEITKVVPDFSPADTIATLDDGTTAKIPDYSRLFKIIVSKGIDIQGVCDSLQSFSEVIIAEPNYIFHLEAKPNGMHPV